MHILGQLARGKSRRRQPAFIKCGFHHHGSVFPAAKRASAGYEIQLHLDPLLLRMITLRCRQAAYEVESNGALAPHSISGLYGEPSSSSSLPFFAISAPSFVLSSGALGNFSSSPYAACPARNSRRQGQLPGWK